MSAFGSGFSLVGFFAQHEDGSWWRVIAAEPLNTCGLRLQKTEGPDGQPGPDIPSSCAHMGPRAKPPGWRGGAQGRLC